MEAKKIKRAKTWEVVLFGSNQFAINLYAFFMGFVSYYLNGYMGVAVVFATSFATAMRIWDAFTDPVAGSLLDRIQMKFGKYRAFLLIGNVGMMVTTYILYHFSHLFSGAVRLPFFIIMYMIYTLFMTAQNTIGRSSLAILTNDPKQRAACGVSSGIATRLVYSFVPSLFYGTLSTKYGGFNLEFFDAAWKFIAPVSFLFTIIAVIDISSSDREEFMIKSKRSKTLFPFRELWDLMKNNRAMQMLVVAASTDKLASQVQSNATTSVMFYGIVCGNLALSGAISAYTGIPNIIFIVFGCGLIAAKLGEIGAMKFSSWGGIIVTAILIVMCYVGDPTSLALPGTSNFTGWNAFSLIFLILFILTKGFSSIGGSVVTPMIADVTDYETLRTGSFTPGLIGTIFSFVDKFISSFGTTVIGLLCAAIGFSEALPTKDTPFSPQIKVVAIICLFGMFLIGLVFNLIAMHFYPLTKEKMAEIQDEIAEIKKKEGISV
jgi:Na+/melibiose symporter-like transporter